MKAKIFNIQKFSLQDGDGIRTNVFFSGCNLHCKWCSNPECQTDGKWYDLQELLEEVLKDKPFYDKSGGGVTLSGGEVMLQNEFAAEFVDLLHENGVNAAVETAGAVSHEIFVKLAEKLDFIFIDMKHYDSEKHFAGTGAHNEDIIRNLRWVAESGKRYTVRIPVIPGYNNSLKDAEGFVSLFDECGIKKVQLLPFHQLGEGKYEKNNIPYEYAGVPSLKKEDLAEYSEVFKKCGLEVILN